MPLTLSVTRGTTLVEGRPLTVADLNLLGLPTVTLSGSVGSSDLAAGAVGPEHVQPGICVGTATGTNALSVTLSPGLAAHAGGKWFWIVPGSNNTGPVTLQINALAARELVRVDGSSCEAGDIKAQQPFLVTYHEGWGKYVLMNPVAPKLLTATDTGTANALEVTVSWDFPAYSALKGQLLCVRKGIDPNTGPVTLDVNGKGPVAIWHGLGRSFRAGELPGNAPLVVVYDGDRFRALSGYQTTEDGGNLIAGATVTVDTTAGSFFRLDTGTVTGNLQLTPTGTPTAGYSLMVLVTYGVNGGVITGPTGTLWAGGSAPEAGLAGRRDLVGLTWTGSVWLGMYRTNFS